MSDIQKFLVKDNGNEYEFYLEPGELSSAEIDDDDDDYRDISLPTIDMKAVHKTIRGYARYAIGAFINFGVAEVQEMNLEFNLKLAGKAGLPVLAKGSAEGTFKVQVKCKFPDQPNSNQNTSQ